MHMKKLAILPVAALMLFWFAACDVDFGFELANIVNEETSETSDDAWTGYSNGINVVSSTTYTVDELFALYSAAYLSGMSDSEKSNTQLGFEAFCKASISDYGFTDTPYWVIASVTYSYEAQTLPGSLIWCTHGESKESAVPINPRYFVIDSHWTMTGADEFPSVGAAPVIALAHMDAVYVCPDQMAAGEAQPYLCEEITANRTIAMAKASMGYLHENGMSPLKVCEGYSVGYSQGGASALAVHRAIEQDAALEQAIGFRGTYSGAGPYSMTITLDKWKEWSASGDLAFPAAIGLIALAWDAYYPELTGTYSAVNCFLSQKFRDSGALTQIAARSANIGVINNTIKSSVGAGHATVSELLAEDWASNASYKFMQIAERNDLLDRSWTPKHPIVFFHSTEDEVVPYANTERAMEVFPSNLTTLHQQTGDHSSVGVQFYSWLGLQKGFPMAKD